MLLAVVCQVLLFAYHQTTTLVDLFPFNGVRNTQGRERLIEAAVNGVLMLLPPVGFALRLHGLMIFGAVYYLILFFIEIIIWWVPYFTDPAPAWRKPYNFVLALATSNFDQGDTLANWVAIHRRLHSSTVTPLRPGKGPILPNLEHIILHAWTMVTALVTLKALV